MTTEIAGVLLLEPRLFRDHRGFFVETYRRDRLHAIGISHEFVQDNHSHSKQSVLRGLHYQLHAPQGKLVRVVRGEIFDVAVDLRQSSPTFGRHVARRLSDENHQMMWIPPGFAHGFLALTEIAEVVYKTTAFYAPDDERTVRWNDPELGINWPIQGEPILSAKDAAAPLLRHAETYE